MAEILNIDGGSQPKPPAGDVLILREQLAAQVVAVMQSHFSRPNACEMREILSCADGQIKALEVANGK